MILIRSVLFLSILFLGLASCKEQDVSINPPDIPLSVFPLNNDTLIAQSIEIEWLSLDDTEGDWEYDIFLSQDSEPKIYQENVVGTTLLANNLPSGSHFWNVIARNEGGETRGLTSRFYLINPTDMPTLSPINLLSSTKSQVEVSSVISDLDEVIEQGFVISRSSNPTKVDRKIVVDPQQGNFTQVIDELYDGVTYYIRSFATTEIGTIYSDGLSFVSWDDSENDGIFYDQRDENEYPYIRIGGQKWMTRNIAYLPEVHEPLDGSIEEPRYYVYGYDGNELSEAVFEDTYQTYGTLYNWSAVMQDDIGVTYKAQGVCPTGWHVPNDEEWDILLEYIGGRAEGGGKLKEAGFSHWVEPNTGATDEYGFTALPAGARGVGEIPFQTLGTRTFWWSATERDPEFANRKYLYNEYSAVGDYYQLKSVGFSIRCVKD